MIIVDTKQPVKLQVDCGAEINVISKRYIPNMMLEESSMTLQMWNNMTTKTIGKTRLIVRNSENNKKYNIEFQVIKEGSNSSYWQEGGGRYETDNGQL